MSCNSYILDFCLRQDCSTDFKFLPYDVSLLRCQRYFQSVQNSNGLGANTISVFVNPQFFTKMRSTPSVGQTGVYSISDGANNLVQSATGLVFFDGNTDGCFIQLENYTSTVQSRPNMARFINNNKITLSAEL